jgi:endonuclease-3
MQLAPSPKKVFAVFKKHYQEIPLIPIGKTPFQVLVAVLLSSRTKDETTAKVCKRLFKFAPTPQKLIQLNELKIRNLIYPVGFYKTKARYLKELAKILIKKYNGQVPSTFEELTDLPGIGRKSANIVLNRVYNTPAIGVDTHVHRIANVLGWVKTKTPEQTEKQLIKILPKKYWGKVNQLMVSIGRQYKSKRQLEDFLRKEGLI